MQHVIGKISHFALKERAHQFFRLKRSIYKADFSAFLRDIADDAAEMEICEGLQNRGNETTENYNISDRNDGSGSKGRNNKSSKRKCGNFDRDRDKEDKRKAKKSLLDCLNPKCNEKNFVRDGPITSEFEKKNLLKAYEEKLATDRKKKRKYGHASALQGANPDDSSHFEATFLAGIIRDMALTDTGADVSLFPPSV